MTSPDSPDLACQRRHARAVAADALRLTKAGNLPAAAKRIETLNGTGWLSTAILEWVDAFIDRRIGRENVGQPFRIAWTPVETGGIRDADQTPPSARWAGRLIAARMADDEATFRALLRTPTEGAELGDAIIALLQMVAISLQRSEIGIPTVYKTRGGAR